MSCFLDEMSRASSQRVAAARRTEPMATLERRAQATPPPPRLRLSPAGFDVIAEIKLRSPAAGVLGAASDDWLGRAAAYARAGAAAVSVLTEPTRFDGSLSHLEAVAAAVRGQGVPAMRKDFLVDPYQVCEARAAGAGGVLIILRMLSRAQIVELLDAARQWQLFVLLEAFDAADLALAANLAQPCAVPGEPVLGEPVLVGVNSRDLQTLEVVPERFAALAPLLPRGVPAVAESGVGDAGSAAEMRRLGFSVALIGTALMVCDEPAHLLAEIFAATRTVSP
jgi:indole-3-glycerol phosphate synthase